MKRLLKICLIIMMTITGMFGISNVKAQAKTSVNNFQIKPLLPSGNSSQSSYFDLKVKPGTSQTLRLQIINNSSKRQQFNILPNNAATNENGIIDYSVHAKKDASATTSFTDMLGDQTGKQIWVAGKSRSVVSFKLAVPKQSFEGTVLGGFIVYSASAANQAKKSGQNSNLAHYAVAARLIESTQKVTPDLLYKGTKYVGNNGLPRIQVNLQNNQPTIIGTVHLKATVTGEGDKTVAKVDQKMLNFAPNSSFGVASRILCK